MKLENAILYALNSNKETVEQISKILDIQVGQADIRRFADGEIYACPKESVRGKNVYILQSTCPPVTERLMEILVFADALKRASAKVINLVSPYFGYARQDRKSRSREPITARLVADILEVSGIKRVVTLDLHTPQIQGFFSIPLDDASVIPIFSDYITSNLPVENLIIVSPDHGGVARARRLAAELHAPLAIIDKRRTSPNVAEVMNIIGDVSNKICVLVDDIIDTAGTLEASVKALKEAGAQKVYACATHGVLSYPAIERICNNDIEKVLITNSIPLKVECDKIVVLDISHFLAKIIDSIEKSIPLSQIW